MSKAQAWERLNDTEYSGRLTMAQFHDLLCDAGYSEETARKAALQRGWNRLEAGATL